MTEAIDYVKTELMPDFDFDAFNHENQDNYEGSNYSPKKIQILTRRLQLQQQKKALLQQNLKLRLLRAMNRLNQPVQQILMILQMITILPTIHTMKK